MSARGSRALIALAILSLVVSLAGRTFHHSCEQHTAVRPASARATHQHLDRDSVSWTAPVAQFMPPLWRAIAAHVPSPGEPWVARDIGNSLYNRPPPAC